MIDPIELLTLPRQPVAMIRCTVAASELPRLIGPALEELFGAIATQRRRPTGPWLSWHLRRPSATFDMAICVPVDAEVEPTGRVQPGELPAARVARTTYYGPYEGLAAAWGACTAAIAAAGHTPADDLWEQYLAGPDSGLPAAQWRTRLVRPLRATV